MGLVVCVPCLTGISRALSGVKRHCSASTSAWFVLIASVTYLLDYRASQ